MGGVPGTKEGSESWTTVGKCTSAHHRRGPQRPLQAGGPAQHAFRILQGDGSWPRVGGKRARAGRVRGGDTRPPEGGGQRGGGGWAGGAWRHCKLRITSSAVCEGRSAAVPGLREMPSGPLTGGVMEPGAGCAAHRRSIRKVSSVAGSARTMSGSLSMCSPSRVKGSILSSSRGNWLSESKLTSPTPASVLVSSLDRLGGDSPVTGREGTQDEQESQRGPGSLFPCPAPPWLLSMLREEGLGPHQRCLSGGSLSREHW